MLFSKTIRLGLISLWWVLSGCSVGSPEVGVAQKVADSFYQAQQQQELEKALSLYSDARVPEEWRTHLENLNRSLGTVQSYSLKNVEVNTVLSGRLYLFDYQVNYSSGKGAAETLTLFDSVEPDDEPRIASHTVAAEGFNARQ